MRCYQYDICTHADDLSRMMKSLGPLDKTGQQQVQEETDGQTRPVSDVTLACFDKSYVVANVIDAFLLYHT